ncbi:hypothetical protein MMC12_008487 [Toensbergia leucococca]|nr:hypothetical protein [Toensbergia leucococca]
MTLRPPVRCLRFDTRLGSGLSGNINYVSSTIVIKFPHNVVFNSTHDKLDTSDGRRRKEMLEQEEIDSVEAIENEKQIYRTLMRHRPHPNVIQALLCLPEGIFLPRLPTTVRIRLECSKEFPIGERIKLQWAAETAVAAAWLETLDLAHGDIRCGNLLLDQEDHIKLADFDTAVKIGEDVRTYIAPHWAKEFDKAWVEGGVKTEQYAIGICLYRIFTEVEADLLEIEETRVFPDVTLISCGSIIHKCFYGRYLSIAQLAQDLKYEYLRHRYGMLGSFLWYIPFMGRLLKPEARVIEDAELQRMRKSCTDFLQTEHQRDQEWRDAQERKAG